MSKTPSERAADRIKFQTQFDTDRLNNSDGYLYGSESTINYKKNKKKKKKPKKNINKKNSTVFDIIDLED